MGQQRDKAGAKADYQPSLQRAKDRRIISFPIGL